MISCVNEPNIRLMRQLFIILMVLHYVALSGQSAAESARVADSTFKSNVVKSRIDGVYIPKNIEDAMLELDRLSPPESKVKYKEAEELVVAKKLHFGLGRWMSVNWSFVPGSRISKLLTDIGLIMEEEKINFMLRMYHRHLNGKPLMAIETAKEYIQKREDEYRKMMKEQHGIDSVVIRKPKF